MRIIIDISKKFEAEDLPMLLNFIWFQILTDPKITETMLKISIEGTNLHKERIIP